MAVCTRPKRKLRKVQRYVSNDKKPRSVAVKRRKTSKRRCQKSGKLTTEVPRQSNNLEGNDIVVTYNNEDVPLRKVNLVSGSTYFESRLGQNWQSKDARIVLNFSVDIEIFKRVMEYLCTGNINITPGNIQDIFVLSSYLLIDKPLKNLTGLCKEELKNMTNEETVNQVRSFAIMHALWDIVEHADDYMEQNFELIQKRKTFIGWKFDEILRLVSSDRIQVSREDKVLKMTCIWLNTNFAKREQHLYTLLDKIRFKYLKSDSIMNALGDDLNLRILQACLNHRNLVQMSPSTLNMTTPRCYYKGVYLLERFKSTTKQKFQRYWPHDGSVKKLRSPTLNREFSMMVTLNDKVYSIGGHNGGTYSKEVEVYDPVTDSWSMAASMLCERCGHDGCSFDGKIYVFGGSNSPHSFIGEVYCPVANTWQQIPNDRPQAGFIKAIAHDDSIFVIGGNGGPESQYCSIQEYKPHTHEWFDIPQSRHLRKKPRQYDAIAYKRKLYIFVELDDRLVTYNMDTKETVKRQLKLGFDVGCFYRYLLFRDRVYTFVPFDNYSCGGKNRSDHLHSTQITTFDVKILEGNIDLTRGKQFQNNCRTTKAKSSIANIRVVATD